ncbi:MAG TPA: hypothetical protein VGP88_00955, partial [Thermoplasmata archaeon]|nr:hypothetical protein [Thermoplasmata archaeon]
MPNLTCGDVRTYLASVAAGTPPASPPPTVWDSMVRHGAVEGTSSAPKLTDVGRHVLRELQVRAARTDPLALEVVSEQLSRIGTDLDGVAKSASYFLAELGPVVPVEAVPLLRIVALGLANRRETPEEIAEEFRNAWGSVEVMGGNPRDRLLAAELLNAESAPITELYATLMQTMERVRARGGDHASAATVATILHLAALPDKLPALDAFFDLRAHAMGDEAAALLAATGRPTAEAIAARDQWVANLPKLDPVDARLAATYLVGENATRSDIASRIATLVPLLAPRFARPGVAAALLATSAPIDSGELLDWLDKAEALARARKLAPTPGELHALSLALVHGLPAREFVATT